MRLQPLFFLGLSLLAYSFEHRFRYYLGQGGKPPGTGAFRGHGAGMIGILLNDRYKIAEEIGEGGMATVYRAVDTRLQREVAIKILHPHLAKDVELCQRFQQEASIAARLEHANIVKIYDYGSHTDGRAYIVSELIRGENFHHLQNEQMRLHSTPFDPLMCAMVCEDILKGLIPAHAMKFVHRDVKPDNVMITTEGWVKLTDFGIAKNTGTSITVVGHFLGSPSYSSPEQIQGKAVDFRSDLWALGIILYEAISGRLPFSGSSAAEVMVKICQGTFTPLAQIKPSVPEALDAIINKALKTKKEERFDSTESMTETLRAFLANAGIDNSSSGLLAYFKDKDAFLTAHRLEKAPGKTTKPTPQVVRKEGPNGPRQHEEPQQPSTQEATLLNEAMARLRPGSNKPNHHQLKVQPVAAAPAVAAPAAQQAMVAAPPAPAAAAPGLAAHAGAGRAHDGATQPMQNSGRQAQQTAMGGQAAHHAPAQHRRKEKEAQRHTHNNNRDHNRDHNRDQRAGAQQAQQQQQQQGHAQAHQNAGTQRGEQNARFGLTQRADVQSDLLPRALSRSQGHGLPWLIIVFSVAAALLFFALVQTSSTPPTQKERTSSSSGSQNQNGSAQGNNREQGSRNTSGSSGGTNGAGARQPAQADPPLRYAAPENLTRSESPPARPARQSNQGSSGTGGSSGNNATQQQPTSPRRQPQPRSAGGESQPRNATLNNGSNAVSNSASGSAATNSASQNQASTNGAGNASQPTPPTVKMDLGRIAFQTIPAGVPVFIDDIPAGESGRPGLTKSFEVKPGPHVVTLKRTEIAGVKYSEVQKRVYVEAGKNHAIGVLRMTPIRTLTLSISGPGVIVRVNGDPYPMTGKPMVLSLPEGKVEVEARASNGKSLRRILDLRGDNFTLNSSLE